MPKAAVVVPVRAEPAQQAEGISPALFRNGMACLASGISVVTTFGCNGHSGFTASSVSSVTDTPPTLLVCINRAVSSCAEFTQNRQLAISLLTDRQEHLSNRFSSGKLSREERFAGVSWEEMSNGCRTVSGCLAAFSCRISDIHEVGTHNVLYCVVEEMRLGSGNESPLLWFSRSYHTSKSCLSNSPVV